METIAVTKVLGCFQQAYYGPGLKFEERSKAMFLQQELVFAAMGSDMFDVRVLLRRHYGSFPVRLLLDLRRENHDVGQMKSYGFLCYVYVYVYMSGSR